MHCFEMQDWITIKTTLVAASMTTVTQSEHGWLDLADYRDVVLWSEAVQVGTTAAFLSFETAPEKDEALFAVAVPPFQLMPFARGVTVNVVHRDTAAIPLARWLRWKTSFTANTAGTVTFRVWVAAAGDHGG